MSKPIKTPTQRSKEIALTREEHAKALAYFVYRFVVEDLHAEYKIPDKVIEQKNREAIDRAALYLKLVEEGDEDLLFAFVNAQFFYTRHWDKPKETKDTKEQEQLIREFCAGIKADLEAGK